MIYLYNKEMPYEAGGNEMITITKISANKWILSNGARIWKDDFGSYQIDSDTDFEVTNTLEKAIEIASSKRFSKQ